jgi:hypothetical protein
VPTSLGAVISLLVSELPRPKTNPIAEYHDFLGLLLLLLSELSFGFSRLIFSAARDDFASVSRVPLLLFSLFTRPSEVFAVIDTSFTICTFSPSLIALEASSGAKSRPREENIFRNQDLFFPFDGALDASLFLLFALSILSSLFVPLVLPNAAALMGEPASLAFVTDGVWDV